MYLSQLGAELSRQVFAGCAVEQCPWWACRGGYGDNTSCNLTWNPAVIDLHPTVLLHMSKREMLLKWLTGAQGISYKLPTLFFCCARVWLVNCVKSSTFQDLEEGSIMQALEQWFTFLYMWHVWVNPHSRQHLKIHHWHLARLDPA